MDNASVWYSVHNDRVPHLAQGQTFSVGLSEAAAKKVAKNLKEELQYILGKDFTIITWVT